jgi:uncharacterized membrane protein
MMPRRKTVQRIAALACGGAYLVASYFAAGAAAPSLLGTLLGILPFAAVTLALAWRSRVRNVALGLYLACLALVVGCFDFLRVHAAWLYFLQDAGVMVALGVVFGATLWAGDERALCSRIAMVLQGRNASPELLRYTWKVTLAWTIFFFLYAFVSALLFAFAPIKSWSAFANLGAAPLLGVMFLGEYWIRLRAVPDHAQVSVQAIIDAYLDQKKPVESPGGPTDRMDGRI